MLFNVGKLIVSNYVAVSITTDCRTFLPHRCSSAAYKTVCTQLTKAYMAETSCNQLLNSYCYVIAHNQFTSF